MIKCSISSRSLYEQKNSKTVQSGENNIENNTGAEVEKTQRKNSPIVKGKNLLGKHCFQFTTKTNNSLSIKISVRIMWKGADRKDNGNLDKSDKTPMFG